MVFDNGSTEEDIVALMQAKIYDIEIVVIDHHFPGELITKTLKNGEMNSLICEQRKEDLIYFETLYTGTITLIKAFSLHTYITFTQFIYHYP